MSTAPTFENDVALFESATDLELELKVRSDDHDNSWRAAAKMDVPAEHLLKGKLYRLLVEHGPQTHDSLFELYVADGGTRTIQRVRTSVKEMSMTRKPRTTIPQVPLVRPAPEGGTSAHGGPSQKWEAIPATADDSTEARS